MVIKCVPVHSCTHFNVIRQVLLMSHTNAIFVIYLTDHEHEHGHGYEYGHYQFRQIYINGIDKPIVILLVTLSKMIKLEGGNTTGIC